MWREQHETSNNGYDQCSHLPRRDSSSLSSVFTVPPIHGLISPRWGKFFSCTVIKITDNELHA